MTTTLKRSKDRKVANAVNAAGKVATIANTFGLPSGKAYSCPGATGVCETICYAGKLEVVYKGVRDVLLHNFEILSSLDVDGMVAELSGMVEDFKRDSVKRGATPLFRIHWDGDFFSDDYAEAWRVVVARHADVRFWVYTRVVSAAVMLHKASLPNLSLYFSADEENAPVASMLRRTYGIRMAWLAENFQVGQAAVKALTGKPGAKCPENAKRLALISPEGSACVRCGLCVYGKADVVFSRSKK
jgi:ferredoxin